MTSEETAKHGTTVYQIVVNGQRGNIVADFHTGLEQVGYRMAGSEEAFRKFRSLNEFPGLDTAELAGSFAHRIRYEMLGQTDEYVFEEHRLTGYLDGVSLVSTIPLSREFDPGFEVQAALNAVAREQESVEQAASKLEAILTSHVQFARLSKSDDAIVSELGQVHQRMKGEGFAQAAFETASDFLNELPKLARERFNELAAELQPSVGMTI